MSMALPRVRYVERNGELVLQQMYRDYDPVTGEQIITYVDVPTEPEEPAP